MAQADKLAPSINQAAHESGFVYLDSYTARNEQTNGSIVDDIIIKFINSYSEKTNVVLSIYKINVLLRLVMMNTNLCVMILQNSYNLKFNKYIIIIKL